MVYVKIIGRHCGDEKGRIGKVIHSGEYAITVALLPTKQYPNSPVLMYGRSAVEYIDYKEPVKFGAIMHRIIRVPGWLQIMFAFLRMVILFRQDFMVGMKHDYAAVWRCGFMTRLTFHVHFAVLHILQDKTKHHVLGRDTYWAMRYFLKHQIYSIRTHRYEEQYEAYRYVLETTKRFPNAFVPAKKLLAKRIREVTSV